MNGRVTSIPMLGWLPSYRKGRLRFDLIAGLTTAAVVIPKAMAFAAIAGLPLVVGLYTSLVPLVVYAVMGTSRPLSVTTTSTIAILTLATLNRVTPGGDSATLMAAAATLALLTGGYLLLAGVFQLGAIANFISYPVLIGFKTGIGMIIVLDQIPKMLGMHISKSSSFQDIAAIFMHLPETSIPTLVLALAMLALMVGMKHFTPRVPALLVAVAIGIAVSVFFGLDKMGVGLVGTVQAGLPAFALPDLSLVKQLWPDALGIALMSFIETAAAGRIFIKQGEPHPDANRELVALGMANLAGSLLSNMPAGGGTTQTAVNDGAGARSQVAGLVAAAVVMATLLFLAPLFSLMPHATLAAVVLIASMGLVSPAEFRAIRKIRSMEFGWALFSLAGVLLLGTLKGILVAVAASMLALIHHANQPPIFILGRKPGTNVFRTLSPEHPEDETFSGLLLVRPEGAMYFANAFRVAERIRALVLEYRPKVLVFDASAMPDIEFTALMMLKEGERNMQEEGTVLWMAALNHAPLLAIHNSPLGERLGRERMFFTLVQAVEKYLREMEVNPGP
ncbi:MAG TPA: SulP family inorganic anion transporter [Geobacteraceae bacterium]|nr:SulP family inorganic anion transporter [Geobacteraceae bacterium]